MSDGLANPMIQIAARTLHLTNNVAVLRCTVGNRQWLLGDDPEVEAAFATLNRKLREKTLQLKAIEDIRRG